MGRILLGRAYGERLVATELPLGAIHGDLWVVTGTGPPENSGRVAVVRMRRLDGRVVAMIHER